MRRVFVAAICGGLSLAAAPAWADASQTRTGGGLGGGLLEAIFSSGKSETSALAPPVPTTSAAPESVNFAPRQVASIAPQEPTAVRREVAPEFLRQEVAYPGPEKPGVIVVDTPNKFLFYVEPGGKAMRYGIGVGRPGFTWSGVKAITRKAEWPDWTPPQEMLLRRPDLPLHMDGGPENPLGARALYLGSSMYRIHGTNEPWTIGQNVSSGCIRMMNEDVEDLYERVKVGTRVIVM